MEISHRESYYDHKFDADGIYKLQAMKNTPS